MKIIGISGGICSGKSLVASILRKHGLPVIDADKLGHEACSKGTSCYHNLVDTFGPQVLDSDGNIDRKCLGNIVFANSEKMDQLKAIVWPEIRNLLLRDIAKYREEGCNAIAIEAAVMIEASWQDLMSTIWIVHVDKEVALKRLVKRNNLTDEAAQSRLASQLPSEERMKFANFVITNNDLSEPQLEELVLKQLAVELK